MTDIFDNIPPYDPDQEKRQKPREGEQMQTGIWVGTGETKKLVPPEEVYKLALLGCTDTEIAEWWGITQSTLRFNFSEYMAKARAQLKQRLRHAQIKTALGGNVTMLIWLGKQYLDQSDQPVNTSDNQPLPWCTTDQTETTDVSQEQTDEIPDHTGR